MRRGGVGQSAGWVRFVPPVVLALAMMTAPGNSAGEGSLVTGSYQLDWSQDVDRKDDKVTDVRTLKQTLELKYKGLLSPVVRNEITFKVEQEIKSDAPDITRFLPTLDLNFKGRYWEAKTGAKRTHENSDEPGKNPKITDAYVVELFYVPPRRVPDLKLKYTIDTENEEGVTDTRKDDLTVSSVYNLGEWLTIKGDYERIVSDDRLQPNADTKEQKKNLALGVRRAFFDTIKFDAQYTYEGTASYTVVDAGGTTNGKEDQKHTLKSLLSFRPFRNTTLDGSYDIDVSQNIAAGSHILTSTGKAVLSQKIGTPLDARGEFQRVITEDRHSADDKKAIEDTLTAELKAKFSKHLDFLVRYQDKKKDEVHLDPTKSKMDATTVLNATWTGELAPFWKAFVSYDKTDTFGNEVKTTVDTKYSLKTTFDFKAINLVIDPTYDITLKEDLVTPENSEVRDFKFRVTYLILRTANLEAKIDHTYGRKTDSLAGNIQRTDNSTGNVVWINVLPGWTVGYDMTRTATDTSEDDLPPDIITTFAFKVDYVYRWITFNTSYKYDKKSLTADVETFDIKAGWVAPKWETSLAYTATKTFSELLDEGYTFTLLFKVYL